MRRHRRYEIVTIPWPLWDKNNEIVVVLWCVFLLEHNIGVQNLNICLSILTKIRRTYLFFYFHMDQKIIFCVPYYVHLKNKIVCTPTLSSLHHIMYTLYSSAHQCKMIYFNPVQLHLHLIFQKILFWSLNTNVFYHPMIKLIYYKL